MATIDAGKLFGDMVTAATGAAGGKWPVLRDYAETELKKLAQTAVQIELLKAKNKIDQDEAEMLIHMQHNASRAVLLGIEGIGLLIAEATINAASGVLKGALNTATGFKLL